eukprot:UN25406
MNANFLNPSITEQQNKPLLFLTDILDGRLLHYIASEKRLLDYAKNLGLSDKNVEKLESLWKGVCDVSGVELDLFPILERDEQRVKRADREERGIAIIPAEKKACCILKNEFTDASFKQILSDLEKETLAVDAPDMGKGWFWEELEMEWHYGRK